MNIYRLCYRELFFLFFLTTASFNSIAGYVMYGYVENIRAGYPDFRVNVSLDDLDWDDARDFKCARDLWPDTCKLYLEVTVNGSGNITGGKFFFWHTAVEKQILREAGVRTLGQYFQYLRNQGISILGQYEWQGSHHNPVESFNVCLLVSSGAGLSSQSVACSRRGIGVLPGCSIQASELSLNHGTLTADRVNGHRASADLTIICDGNGSARLMAPNPEPKLPLAPDGSLFTNITVGGKPLAEGVVVNAGPGGTRVTLTSTLGSLGTPRTGQFSGSVVVILARP
ncbi:TPA: hypothetical protein ACKQDN_002360 [Serratia marcescens]